LNEEVLKILYSKSDGNQRSIIKLIRLFVDKIVYDEMSLDQVISSSQVEEIAASEAKALKVKGPSATGTAAAKHESTEQEKTIIQKIEELMADEDYTIEANPQSLAGATLKSMKVLMEKYGKEAKITSPSPEFAFKNRKYKLAGLIEFDGVKWGFEIPSVRSFSKSGGVAAFYAAKRFSYAFSGNSMDKGILIVPQGTSGAKYLSLLKEFEGRLLVYEFNEESAIFLISQALKDPSKEAWQMTQAIVGDLPEYQPPIPPWEQPKEQAAEEEKPTDAEDAESTPPSE
jgi:hypothetical protein